MYCAGVEVLDIRPFGHKGLLFDKTLPCRVFVHGP
jgi:hypothetical protein